MAVGFTGTRRGMTGDQVITVAHILQHFFDKKHKEFHHGGEPHSDAQAAEMAEMIGYNVIVHPGGTAAENLKRNHEIVNASTYMIAAPHGVDQVWRGSGTWATIRYANGDNAKKPPGGHRPMYVVWPDGSIANYNTRPL
jgi:hypothetical protein